ncbi:MAG: endopeptidase La [Thermomicrobiales bacterium]|nr:endopeptidase La [Thermomicrobiales bacterium]
MRPYRLNGPRANHEVPLLPLRNNVIFPRTVPTIQLGRPRSIHAVEEATITGHLIAITAHKDQSIEDPRPEDLFEYATLGSIISTERLPGGNLQVVLEGIGRIKLLNIENKRPFFMATVEEIPEPPFDRDEAESAMQHIKELHEEYTTYVDVPDEEAEIVQIATNPGHLADLLATQLIKEISERQRLLEMADPLQRLLELAAIFTNIIERDRRKDRIRGKLNQEFLEAQRKAEIQKEIEILRGELDGDAANEFDALRVQIRERGMPQHAAEKLEKEVVRLEKMPGVSAESTVARTYIETVLGLPWHETTADRIDLADAEEKLDRDHFGLEQVKERIIEFLAVRSLTMQNGGTTSSQILCLVGPPGVGKTSLGRSIAEAMDRKFVLVSLAGVRDESEIRGHRRTYVGAMPGRIINAMKNAESMNPVILLDEIDKLSGEFRGDPTAALLEVLDPNQNSHFTDHYLDMPYDLSQVLFITTANYIQQIPQPLRDRMEIIPVSQYTEDEKVEIGRRHLLRRQLAANGVADIDLRMDGQTWHQLVRYYTREAGVRGLEREIASLSRKIATQIVRGTINRDAPVVMDDGRLEQMLGPAKYAYEPDLGESQIGEAIGLAASEVGGAIVSVEVVALNGRGDLIITGQAGDVMRESAQAALSYARSRSEELKIDRDFQTKTDLHIHLADGATPKDGPSAGITMASAVISALTQRPIRNDTAMTGEITLRGRVLPIGGLRDKTLAAHRHGIRRIIAPKDNERDLRDIPANVRDDMEFIFVKNMDEVIQAAIMLDIEQADQLQNRAEEPRLVLAATPDVIE